MLSLVYLKINFFTTFFYFFSGNRNIRYVFLRTLLYHFPLIFYTSVSLLKKYIIVLLSRRIFHLSPSPNLSHSVYSKQNPQLCFGGTTRDVLHFTFLLKICEFFTRRQKNRPFLKMKFANKGIDALNLSNILNQKSVQINIPPYF